MTLIGLQVVGKFAANNYKNEMAKSFISEGGSKTQKGDVNEFTAKFSELFLMTYFGSCFVKKDKLQKIQKTQAEMTKELDMGKTFDKLDQPNVSDLEEKLKSGTFHASPIKMTNREKVIQDMLIKFDNTQHKIMKLLDKRQEEGQQRKKQKKAKGMANTEVKIDTDEESKENEVSQADQNSGQDEINGSFDSDHI